MHHLTGAAFFKALLVSLLLIMHLNNDFHECAFTMYQQLMVWTHRKRIRKRKQTEWVRRVKGSLVTLGWRINGNDFTFVFCVTTNLIHRMQNELNKNGWLRMKQNGKEVERKRKERKLLTLWQNDNRNDWKQINVHTLCFLC